MPCVDRTQNREQTIVERRHDEQQRADRDRRADGGLYEATLQQTLLDRRQPRSGRRELLGQPSGGTAAERSRLTDFERAAQLSRAQRLFALDRCRDGLACRATREASRGPRDDRDVGREHQQPHEERNGTRQRHPPRAAQRRSAECENQAGCADGKRESGDDVHPSLTCAFAVDELEDSHGVGRLVTA